jgi:two-component system OmpR family sensor kinase
VVFSDRGDRQVLTAAELAQLRSAASADDPVTVHLPGHQDYRVIAQPVAGSPVTLVVGLPTRAVDDVVGGVVLREGALAALAVLVAGLAATALVRRELRPLRHVAATADRVAAMPLETGEVGVTARVPEELTDERTEVGQVGAALNSLLGQIEGALDARHRSELQVRQFVADASHELRTPLATIQGYAELARRTSSHDPDAPARALGKVEDEAARMTALVEDLLLLARLDAGRPLARDEVDLTRLALETVSDARVLAPAHHWRLELPDAPVVVSGDGQRLRQVLVNLLSNAGRHTPDGTTVTVRVAEGRPGARVEVHDDGPGIPAAVQPSIFERFTVPMSPMPQRRASVVMLVYRRP